MLPTRKPPRLQAQSTVIHWSRSAYTQKFAIQSTCFLLILQNIPAVKNKLSHGVKSVEDFRSFACKSIDGLYFIYTKFHFFECSIDMEYSNRKNDRMNDLVHNAMSIYCKPLRFLQNCNGKCSKQITRLLNS